MKDTNKADLEEVITQHLHANGEVPTGGRVTEVDYIVMARVRVLNEDGTQRTVYRPYRSSRVESDAHLGMAHMMLTEAQNRSTKWG